MNITKANNLACPIDGERLDQSGKQLTCNNGHSFDIARQGYVNLLPVQHKRSKQPGDSKAMVLARTQFLDTNLYQPIAMKLSEIVSTQMTDDKDMCLLDAGCGEGYYFDYLFKTLEKKQGAASFSFVGLDISKDAILQSTRRNKQISWIVGTNRQPPVEDESVDIILCLFGFVSFDGFSKVLKPGGKIILVDPGPDHLKELREIIYPELKNSEQSDLAEIVHTGFSQIDGKTLLFKTRISDNETINNLLVMTPHFYRASKPGRQAASKLTELEITANVIFRVLEKV